MKIWCWTDKFWKKKKYLQGTSHFYHKRWYDMKYGLRVFKKNIVIDNDLHGKRCSWLLTQIKGSTCFLAIIYGSESLKIKTKEGLLQYLINNRKSHVQSWWLAKERILLETYHPCLCISLHLHIIMNQWKIRRWKKTPILMCLKRLRKITYDHLNIQRHRWMCWMKYHNHTHIKEIQSRIKQNT